MTLFDTGVRPDGRRGVLARLLNLVWAAIFAAGLISSLLGGHPVWVWVVSGLALLGWIVRAVTPDRLAALQIAAEAMMLVAGGVACVPGDVLSGVPLAVAFILILGRLQRPLWLGLAAIPVGIAAIGVGLILSDATPSGAAGRLLGAGAVVAISVLAGISRRQGRTSEGRRAELAAERRRAERLDDHAAVARELHDVLAHGLGGLVIQLDAVDALLESGHVEAAAERVRAARRLAADGLGDARRAVDALRDDAEAAAVPAAELSGMLNELVEAHRALGGTATSTLDAGEPEVPAAQAAALRRTLQEALSNARKHAPGEPVDVRLRSADGILRLTVSNPLGTPGELAATGGGRGLTGMRERFGELPGGSLEAGASSGAFTVTATAAR